MRDFSREDFNHYIPEASEIEKCAKNLETVFNKYNTIERTAYLNWRTSFAICTNNVAEYFIIYAEGYRDSVIECLVECLNDNSDKKVDSLCFPILFNSYHALELYSKAYLIKLNYYLSGDINSFDIKHKTNERLTTCLALMKKIDVKGQFTDEIIIMIQVIINFVNTFDKFGSFTFARYPLNNKNNYEKFIKSLDNETIDLVKLYDQLKMVFYCADSIDSALGRLIENEF